MNEEDLLISLAKSIKTFVIVGIFHISIDEYLALEDLKNYPSKQQYSVLEDIDNGIKDISISSGHGTGKTALLAWIVLYIGLFKLDAKIPMTAPSSSQLTVLLLPEVKKWMQKLPIELQRCIKIKHDSIDFTNNNTAVARTARKETPEALQGFHASFLCWIVDEASGVPSSIFGVIDGSLTGEAYLRILTANPTRNDGYFYDTHHKDRKLWRTHIFNAEHSTNVTPESIQRKRVQYGADSDAYRVRVQGKFAKTSGTAVIPMWLIEDAISREEFNPYGSKIWGVDYADGGRDKTILIKREGNNFYEKKICDISGKHIQSQTALWLAKEYTEAQAKNQAPDVIFIDAIGEGSGLISRLREPDLKHIPVIGVKVSSSAVDKNTYGNLRAELYYRLKAALEDEGKLFNDDDLIGELAAHEYRINERGLVYVSKKEDIKERLGRSPDTADAVMLTCHPFVKQISQDEADELDFIYGDNLQGGISGW